MLRILMNCLSNVMRFKTKSGIRESLGQVVGSVPFEQLDQLDGFACGILIHKWDGVGTRLAGCWLKADEADENLGLIVLSPHVDERELGNIMLHELAHAMTPPRIDPFPYHNRTWEERFKALGGNGSRFANFPLRPRRALPSGDIGTLRIQHLDDVIEITLGEFKITRSKK